MLLITCPVTGRDELVGGRSVRSAVQHPELPGLPTSTALTIACPCGHEHVYRTGRAWEQARGQLPERRSGVPLPA